MTEMECVYCAVWTESWIWFRLIVVLEELIIFTFDRDYEEQTIIDFWTGKW